MCSLNEKLIIVTNVLAPYRIPLFNQLNRKIDVLVLTCNEIEKNRFWEIKNIEFEHHHLSGIKFNYSILSDEPKYVYIKLSILKYAFCKNTIFLIGDASWTSYILAFLLIILGKRYYLWTEHTITSPRRGGLLGRIRKITVNRAQKVFCPGSQTISYLKKIEGRTDGINNLHNTPSEIYYDEKTYSRRKKVKNDLKLIYVGQLIERKSIRDIVRLTKLAQSIGIRCSLDLVGDGELKPFVQMQSSELNIKYLGRLTPEDLCLKYRDYDALVLLSQYEPWGLVVNESLLCGTPCLVSAAVGASDLIDAKNGIVLPENYDDYDLIAALEKLNNTIYNHHLIRAQAKRITPDSSALDLLAKL